MWHGRVRFERERERMEKWPNRRWHVLRYTHPCKQVDRSLISKHTHTPLRHTHAHSMNLCCHGLPLSTSGLLLKICIANLIKLKSPTHYPDLSRIGHYRNLELKRSLKIVYSKSFVNVPFTATESLLPLKWGQLPCDRGKNRGVIVGVPPRAAAQVCQVLPQKPGVWEVRNVKIPKSI